MDSGMLALIKLADVLDRQRGVIGRAALLQRPADAPMFAGGPTLGRFGCRYVFTPAQYGRLIARFSGVAVEASYRTHATTRQASGRRDGGKN